MILFFALSIPLLAITGGIAHGPGVLGVLLLDVVMLLGPWEAVIVRVPGVARSRANQRAPQIGSGWPSDHLERSDQRCIFRSHFA